MSELNLEKLNQDRFVLKFKQVQRYSSDDYEKLLNHPFINDTEVVGNKTGEDYNLQDLLIPGEGIEIEDNGDHTKTIKAVGGGGSAELSEELKSSKSVGGIGVGKIFPEGTPLEQIFRDMLNPIENPTLTNPSATISSAGGVLIEEGVPTAKLLTVSFNRGSINPAYGTSGYRSGPANGYSLNDGPSQTENTFNVTVDKDNKTFRASVHYETGEQPKNSAGENYDNPFPAGSVNTSMLTFEIVAPLWSNAADILEVRKEALISKSAKIRQFNFPSQTSANPEIFDVPASWNVTGVELLNTLSGQWVDCSAEFTITDTTHNDIAYKRYTYNGGVATGARSVRVKWS